MTKYGQLTVSLGLCMSILSCTKESVLPENDESQRIDPVYELIDMKYFLMDNDGIDTTTLKLTGNEINNYGHILSEQTVKINYDELVKQSLFEIDSSNTLPEGIVLDTFNVRVPSNWYEDGSYSLYDVLFPLTTEVRETPYIRSIEDVLTVRIPPRSQLVISAEIDAYNLKCSFRAVFKEQITGIQDTVNGRWSGILRYNSSSLKVKEYPLPESRSGE